MMTPTPRIPQLASSPDSTPSGPASPGLDRSAPHGASSRRRARGLALLPLLAATALMLGVPVTAAVAQTAADPLSILFVGNSFTYGETATAKYYNAGSITDENGTGYGGVPAIFKTFTVEKGLSYDVHIEAVGGQSFQYHYQNKAGIIGQPKWDSVVLQGYSTEATTTVQDASHNRGLFLQYGTSLEQLIHGHNAAANVYLYETWGRADLTYPAGSPYYGQPIETMAGEVREGYNLLAAQDGNFRGIVPAGDTWLSAIQLGIADRNPYDGIDAGKVDLWGSDNYHGSNYGYYLNALLMFGEITGLDPRSLGAAEQAAADLGITPIQALALQALAYNQLQTVPEPSTWAMMLAAGGGLLLMARRRRTHGAAVATA